MLLKVYSNVIKVIKYTNYLYEAVDKVNLLFKVGLKHV